MKILRFLFLTIALFGALGATATDAQKKLKKTHKKSSAKKIEMPKKAAEPVNMPVKNEFRDLFEDSQSTAEEPFVFVARTAKQYGELQKLIENLPPPEKIDFTASAVVAGFAGTRPTAGYAVKFENRAGEVSLALVTPPPGAISAQVLTSPVKVVVVPVEDDKGLTINPDKNWQTKMQSFQVKTGNFEYSGGFVGMRQEFAVSGTIRILRSGNFVTAFFWLTANSKLQRQMSDTSSGAIENGAISLPRVDAGSLVENPRPPLQAAGQLSERDLSLNFESLPTNVADGFQGRGNLTAVKAK